MNDNEHDDSEWPTVTPVPAWIKPILQDEAEKRDEANQRHEDKGRHAAEAINRYLGSLGIEPLSPASWSRTTGLTKAVLLRHEHCDVDDWGVSAGWDGEVTLYSVSDDGIERLFGPLGSVQDAAEARRGPRVARPEPADHELLAEEELRRAALVNPGDEDPFEVAFLAGLRAQARATLALNDTISRLGVRQALRQAAALGEIPLDQVALTAEEKRLLREFFSLTASAAADTDPADGAPHSDGQPQSDGA